jgi:hypothetical protein
MYEFIESIFPLGAFFIIGLLIIPLIDLIKFIIKTIKKSLKSPFDEGYKYIIIDGTENTKYPEKYSEGVFAWYEGGELKISEEYQIENGGDPMVFKKYLLQSTIKNDN